MDGITLFDKTEVGFDSPTTGLVTLLTTAKIVSQTIRQKNLNLLDQVENIWFLFLNGESFDNTGSVRLLYDMKNNMLPHHENITVDNDNYHNNTTQSQLGLENIRAMIELGQLSNINSGTLYLHSHGSSSSSEVRNKLKSYSSRQGISSSDSS